MNERRAAELAGLVMAAAVFAYLGWDGALWDARLQFLLHLCAVAAVAGLIVVAWRGGELPRTKLDLPILILLLAFAVASLSAWNAGLSARAMAGIVATALMLPVALLALRHRPDWTAIVVTLPIIGLSVGALATVAWRRVAWIIAGGPGLPPVRLGHESTPFGSVAVPPFVILAALPVALLIPYPRVRLAVVGALAAAGIPLTLLSGSRSGWIAIAVTLAVMGAARLLATVRRPRLPTRLTPGRVAVAVVGLAIVVGAVAFAAPRVTETSSLVYRGYLWRDTLAAWSADPLMGIGPGAMPFARQAAAPALTFPVRQPHSHNVLLGIGGDAGLIGLAAALLLAVSFLVVAGPWRQASLPGRAASSVLIGVAAGLMFEDLTFVPGFNLLVVLLVAISLQGAGAVRWERVRLRPAALAVAGLAAAALLGVMVLGDSSAVAYRQGVDAAASSRWDGAVASFQKAVALDPWHPTGAKSLAVAADRAGDPRLARVAAEHAVRLNPGDGASWTNLALLCRAEGDRDCARAAADRAVDTASAPGRELANAALVYEWLGDHEAADRAYRLSLLTNMWTGLTLPWPRPIEVGDARAPELGSETADLNALIGRRVHDEPIDPEDYAGLLARALANAMLGEPRTAEGELRRAIAEARGSATTWELAALIRRHYGADVTHELAVGDVARGATLGRGESRPAGAIYDIATFRGYPAEALVQSADLLLPDERWPWVLEPLLAPAD